MTVGSYDGGGGGGDMKTHSKTANLLFMMLLLSTPATGTDNPLTLPNLTWSDPDSGPPSWALTYLEGFEDISG